MTAATGGASATSTFAALGWDDGWAEVFERQPGAPARVTRVDHSAVRTLTRAGPRSATVAVGLPRLVTGDWVAIDEDNGPASAGGSATIVAQAPRRTAIVRRDPGEEPLPQVLAANIDQVWITHAADHPLRAGWLDRALVVAYGSGATPVIVVTKADVVKMGGRSGGDVDALVERLATLAPDVALVVSSTVDGQGLDALIARLEGGRSAALLGRSGSGKSSLINALLGASVLQTRAVRADRKGRHTTTRRALVPVAGGGVIDTPGVRALGLWEPDEGLALAFPDIATLTERCRFNDCSHRHEPGCAVREARDAETLSDDRYRRYITLSSE